MSQPPTVPSQVVAHPDVWLPVAAAAAVDVHGDKPAGEPVVAAVGKVMPAQSCHSAIVPVIVSDKGSGFRTVAPIR